MVVSPWLIQRSPNDWKEPNEFNPCRFADEDQKESVKCSYMPFGKGPRICVGQGFATQEAILIIASIVKNYRISYPASEKEPEAINRATTRPKNGMKLIIEKR